MLDTDSLGKPRVADEKYVEHGVGGILTIRTYGRPFLPGNGNMPPAYEATFEARGGLSSAQNKILA